MDASYGGEGARSQTRALMTLGNQPVGWYSRRRDIVALSVTEAEYIADCECEELKIGTSQKPTLVTNSEGAYNLSKTSKFLPRSQHIERCYHYLWQQAQGELLQTHTIPGKDNPADILIRLTPMSQILAWKANWLGSIGKNISG